HDKAAVDARRFGDVPENCGLRAKEFRGRLDRVYWDRVEEFCRKKTMRKKTEAAQTNTIRLHRILRAPPDRVYRAFLDAGAMAKWLPPNGFTCKVHQMDAKVGGTYKMSFTNFTTGKSHSFGGKYL